VIQVRTVLQPFRIRCWENDSRAKSSDNAKWAVELKHADQILYFFGENQVILLSQFLL
jgi:hypothetical protein